MEKVNWVEIDAEYAGQRVDNYLITRLKGVPKSHIYRILRKGEVRANGGRIKPHYRLKMGDKIRIPPIRISESTAPQALSTGLARRLEDAILYEDEDLIVLNKPSGLAVHGGLSSTSRPDWRFTVAAVSILVSSRCFVCCAPHRPILSWFTGWTGTPQAACLSLKNAAACVNCTTCCATTSWRRPISH